MTEPSGIDSEPETGRAYMLKWSGILAMGVTLASAQIQVEPWAATDELGRGMPGVEECGLVREGRFACVCNQEDFTIRSPMGARLELGQKVWRAAQGVGLAG